VNDAAKIEQRVRSVLNQVIDPCSAGRGVAAGLADMGMVCSVLVKEHGDGPADVRVELRLTSPGCTFQLYFERELHRRMADCADVNELEIVWSSQFDWDDHMMSPQLKERLRRKRETVLRREAQSIKPTGKNPVE
jgi:metal-sulfur cluster biosynthetic enzyme